MDKKIRLVISILVPLVVLAIPADVFGIAGLTVIEHRVIALFFMALFFWVLEPIPLYATSLLVILVELVFISDKAFVLFRSTAEGFGTPLPWQRVIETFADPIIILFLGGFFLAMVSTKYELDINLARLVLKPFGTRPKFVLLGFMIVTAVFSMFMSNTAATAMMLAVMAPVLKSLDAGDKARAAFVLAVPFAANIGGIATPVGTPPNGIALKYLTGANQINFGSWMAFGVPYVIVLLLFCWALFLAFYKSKTGEIRISVTGKFRRNWKSMTASIIFAATIVLWMTDFLHGMNAYVIALVPVVVYSATRIITVADLKTIDWDVLWLMAGGIALGYGLERAASSPTSSRASPSGRSRPSSSSSWSPWSPSSSPPSCPTRPRPIFSCRSWRSSGPRSPAWRPSASPRRSSWPRPSPRRWPWPCPSARPPTPWPTPRARSRPRTCSRRAP